MITIYVNTKATCFTTAEITVLSAVYFQHTFSSTQKWPCGKNLPFFPAKKAICHVLSPDHAVTEEELVTLFASIEAVLKACPLTYISSDPNDLEPQTPGHFLAKKDHIPLVDVRGQTFSWKMHWHHLQTILNHIWQRFHTEYVPSLHPRSKWLKTQRDFKVGDVVTLFEEQGMKKWPLALIIQAPLSPKDGHVRVVTVKLSNGRTYNREVSRLIQIDPAQE